MATYPGADSEQLKLCECGCGQPTAKLTRARNTRGQPSGSHVRFVKGHHLRFHIKAQSKINYPVKMLPDGRVVKIHRLRAEQALGKPLPSDAEVHHVDGSKRPDSPLVICQDSAYHALLHYRTRIVKCGGNPNTQKICARCKRLKFHNEFSPSRFTGSGLHQTCRDCAREYHRARSQRKTHARS